jgi:hypothetical protein
MYRHRIVLPLVAVLAGVAMLAVPPPARADFKLRLQESGYSDQVITWSGDTPSATARLPGPGSMAIST